MEKGEKVVRRTVKHPGKLNVFASFGIKGLGKITVFKEDLTGPLLIDILQQYLVPSLPMTNPPPPGSVVLYHDRDPKYTSHRVQQFLGTQHLQDIGAPPHSPDLNPMENLWAILQQRVQKVWCKDLDALEKTIKKEWKKIVKNNITNLVKSLPERMNACIEAKGDSTDY
jgi:transposase